MVKLTKNYKFARTVIVSLGRGINHNRVPYEVILQQNSSIQIACSDSAGSIFRPGRLGPEADGTDVRDGGGEGGFGHKLAALPGNDGIPKGLPFRVVHFPCEGGFRFLVHGSHRQPFLEHGNSLLPLFGAVGDFRIIGLVEKAAAKAKGNIPFFIQAYELPNKVIGIAAAYYLVNVRPDSFLVTRDKSGKAQREQQGGKG